MWSLTSRRRMGADEWMPAVRLRGHGGGQQDDRPCLAYHDEYHELMDYCCDI
jgi:hypothetical protein